MSEQTEDDFWAQERDRDTAARGKQADPTACGTCRKAVAAGGQVVHDECAQRATLLPAPDAPGYELITGLSEDELAALPPRFHVPAYMESSTPQMWVCAVCWGDGWVTGWPCKTAVKHGLRVFTPEHEAETAAKRQAVRLAELEPQVDRLDHLDRITLPELRREIQHHQDGKKRWRDRAEKAEARVTELETYAHGCDAEGCVLPHSSWCERAKKTAAENNGCTCGKPWGDESPQPHAMHCWTVNPPQAEMDTMRAWIAGLEAQLAEMTRLRDNALRALHRDDVETDIDLEETISAPFYGPGWDWDESDLQRVVREAAGAVRPAFGKLTQQRDQARGLVADLKEQRERRRIRLVAAETDLLEMRGLLSPNGFPRRIPDEVEIHERVAPAVEWLLDRVTELEAELAKYVGHEPTIAEEMAYLSNSLDAVLSLCHETRRTGSLGVTPEAVEQAAAGEWTAATPRPALPWAHVMDDGDLSMFLDDLISAALGRWQTDAEGPIPDRVTLAAIEKACQDWRTPGHGLRGDEPGTGEGR